jgi:hypothetical protein
LYEKARRIPEENRYPEFFFILQVDLELKKLSPQSNAETGNKQDAEKDNANQPFIFKCHNVFSLQG